MKMSALLKTEIPKPFWVRVLVVILLCVSYGALYILMKMTLHPLTSALIPGEAIMARGGFFIMFVPIVAFCAFVAATFTHWQKRHLSRPWVYAGTSPIPALFLGVLLILVFFGRA